MDAVFADVIVRSFHGIPNYDPDELSQANGVLCDLEADECQAQFADQCEINVIAGRYGLTGELPTPRRLAEYGDFTGVSDFHDALEQLRRAEESFEALPAAMRARFDNEPAQLWDFLQDPANDAEAVELGILLPSALPPAPEPASEVPPPAPQG